jgi:hypothetical protein
MCLPWVAGCQVHPLHYVPDRLHHGILQRLALQGIAQPGHQPPGDEQCCAHALVAQLLAAMGPVCIMSNGHT